MIGSTQKEKIEMNIHQRRHIERRIAESAANGLIAAGYKVAVYDGEEIALSATDDVRAIVEVMFSGYEDYFFVHPLRGGNRIGWVHFVYGSYGWDVIADSTDNLELALLGTVKLSSELEHRYV